MRVLLVIVLIILLILLTRLSVILTYDYSGASAVLRVYFIKINIYPRTKEKKEKRKKDKDIEEEKEERGGRAVKFKDLPGMIRPILSKIRKRLRINELTVRYTISCDDAAKAAIYYGSACTAVESLIPALNGNFKIKKQDIKIGVDFTGSGSEIFARGVISLAIWEIIYIALSLITNMNIRETVLTK